MRTTFGLKLGLTVAAIGLCVPSLYGQAPKMAPLPVELPRPGAEGTPPNFNIPNLEKPSNKPRPPFMVPSDVTNVAKGKKVISSEKDPLVGDLSMVTDGDTEQVEGNDVELGAGIQWVQIDLGAPHEIYGILFWHYFQPRVYYSVVVQTADDAEFKTNVQTWFNNDINDKAKLGAGKNLNYIESYEGKLIDVKGAKARYVRLYSGGNNANPLNHYVDVQVYGKVAK